MAANPPNGKDGAARPIIIRRKKVVAGGHHGGAWKVAYADFVTAMMAFFLVMWLVATADPQQRAAIFEYFKNPSMQDGDSAKPAPGQNGPGGSSTSATNRVPRCPLRRHRPRPPRPLPPHRSPRPDARRAGCRLPRGGALAPCRIFGGGTHGDRVARRA